MELAKHHGQGPLALKEMADRQQIPLKYLEQIAMALKGAKLIKSVRGPSGGYVLARPPDKIHLLEIIETLEGSLSFVNCVKDPLACEKVDSCAFNDLWRKISKETSRILRSVTLADMVRQDSRKKSRPASCFEEEAMSHRSR
jgi:Rrf2 family transcriptional regulator, cysteine metabolism repressor